MNKRLVLVLLASVMLLAMAAPALANRPCLPPLPPAGCPGGNVDVPMAAFCTLRYEDGTDDTERRFHPLIGDFYSIPASGGDALLLLGGSMEVSPDVCSDLCVKYLFNLVEFYDGSWNEALAFLRENGYDWRLRGLDRVRVLIYDRDDPDSILYEFEGDLVDLITQSGVEVQFAGPMAFLVRVPLTIPAAAANGTWWQGRMEVWSGKGLRGHSDMPLIVGGFNNWRNGHNGIW